MQFKLWLENRQKGKCLADSGFKLVPIYRACNTNVFKSMDYVTRSLRFAIEHADHMTAVEEEPYHVIKAIVPAISVFEAYNPGEYFYDGPDFPGKIIYKSNLEH